ncbi:Fanconi anemia group F protein [Sphaeramia orbicularis]|uniref:FA complementation group F n=1 Tax=Sphaeramia orbicularis TaxID=375764 RepID=A0A673CEZ5_9TELE|nr:Fanconi anemia group F protein [Sphaeramia orbicularis]
MEATLKNLWSTVELVAVAAHSDVVEQWDGQTLTRAFHWAQYCQHLFHRFHDNPTIRRVMEKQLQLVNESVSVVFPEHTAVSFSDLSRCQHLLLVGLLHNTKLPVSLLRILFDTSSPVNKEQAGYRNVTGLCSSMIECKSACKVLSPLVEVSDVGADAEVQGVLLMERLEALLSQSREPFLDSVLQGCEGAAEHFCLVIAAALLTRKTAAAQTTLEDFLLDWLLHKHSLLQHMCYTLPASLLTDLAKRHVKFREAYCNVLKKWASDMEYSISDGEWFQASTNPTVSFQKLTEHFRSLSEASPSLWEHVENQLNALKVSDGDFDVRGLSVWGDLLSEIHK